MPADFRDTVIPDKTAIIVPTGDQPAFAKGLSRLISDEALRNQMSELGPGFAGGRFGVQRLVSDMSNYYEQLLQEKNVIRHDLSSPAMLNHHQHRNLYAYPCRYTQRQCNRRRKPRYWIVNRLNLGGITMPQV
jgi:hypothetical protein